jgi:hypothetical protein
MLFESFFTSVILLLVKLLVMSAVWAFTKKIQWSTDNGYPSQLNMASAEKYFKALFYKVHLS